MNNIDKAIEIIVMAGKNKKDYVKFATALETLAERERRANRVKEANFILQELGEALAMATMEDP